MEKKRKKKFDVKCIDLESFFKKIARAVVIHGIVKTKSNEDALL